MRRPSRSGVSVVRVGIAARGCRAGRWMVAALATVVVSCERAHGAMDVSGVCERHAACTASGVGRSGAACYVVGGERGCCKWALVRTAVAPPPFDSVQKLSVTLARSKVHRSRTRRSAPYVPVIPRSTNSIPLCRSLTSHGVCWAGLGCRAASLSLCIRDRNRRLWDRSRRLPLPFELHRSWSSPALVARRLRPFYL